ncbi:MAG TPA: recombinase family protein [Terriglobales bacterium]|nr:recombinase family protein [Terriglobales bacterium]
MTDNKIKPSHTQRVAVVYIRQSTASQVEHHRESTARQYALVQRACDLGWPKEQVMIVDEDLGISGASSANRTGFVRLASELALGRVGIILGLEVSRLARNNADWYRLLDLCVITDTLIGDSDGLYHPALFNDRLVLGLKGTMSEAELHIIRTRLNGGIRNKAQRGELRKELPVGFVWGDQEGVVRFHPDEAVVRAIQSVFDRFAELGSVRQVWLWFRTQGLRFPSQQDAWGAAIQWIAPTYRSIHQVLTNPAYAGAYVYGKRRSEQYIDKAGVVQKRIRRLDMKQWAVFIKEHHAGYLDWATFQANQDRISSNVRAERNQSGGAVREGRALLQGIASCGHCGRGLFTYYRGKNAAPGYRCSAHDLVSGGGHYCFSVGAGAIDEAVAQFFLKAITPAAIEASLRSQEQLESDRDAALKQWRLEVERARYEAERVERRYRLVEPENRLVARGLEKEWEERLRDLAAAESELRQREQSQVRCLSPEQTEQLRSLGVDLRQVWTAPTTTDRDRKELLRTLLEEIIISVDDTPSRAQLRMRWKGGAITSLEVALPHHAPPGLRTDEDTIQLLTRLAPLYPDDVIAGIFNRQERKTARGARFTAGHVGNLRRYHDLARFESHPISEGESVAVQKAAEILGVVPSTLHRWINEGVIAAEQPTPGAPWRIRITDELRARFVEQAPPDYVPMSEARRRLGVSRQTILQRVKRGELQTVYVHRGRRKGLRIRVVESQSDLFQQTSLTGVQYET